MKNFTKFSVAALAVCLSGSAYAATNVDIGTGGTASNTGNTNELVINASAGTYIYGNLDMMGGQIVAYDDLVLNADSGLWGHGTYGAVVLQKDGANVMRADTNPYGGTNIYTDTFINTGGTFGTPDTASLGLESGNGAGIGYTNAAGNMHGLWVDGSQAILSGGTNSSVWTLADGDAGGATLTVSGSDPTTITSTVFSATTDMYGNYANTVVGSAGGWGDTTTVQGYGADLNLGYDTATLSADNDIVLNVNNNGMSYGGLVVNDVGYGTTVMEIYSNAQGGSNLYSTLDMNGNQIHGVAPGTSGMDAVNLNQLNEVEKDMSKGIAATTAIANIPQVEAGKKASVGLGYGHYNGENAIAAGASWHFGAASNGIMKVSVGTGGSGETAVGAGASWSW